MRSAAAVFLAELKARRLVLLAALAMSALIPLVALAPALEDQRPSDVREVVSLILVVVFGYGLALAFGATTFGSDLSERRLGFHFARPVGGLAIWVGRMAAVWCVMMLAEALALLPPLLANGGTFDVLISMGWWSVPAFVVGPTFLLLLAHAVSIMVRARTPWLVLDVIAATAASVAGWLALRSKVGFLSPEALMVVIGLFAAVLLAALLLAGTAGTVSGRADLRRTHGALSLVLWLVVGASWPAVISYLHWLDDFGPHDLYSVNLEEVDPTGSWAGIGGYGVGRFETYRQFIVSTSDERWIALRQLGRWRSWWSQQACFAADGRTAAWLGRGRDDDSSIVWRVDLTAEDPTPVETTLTASGDSELKLSPDGRMVVLWDREGLLGVYGLADESLLAMARLPARENRSECTFAADGIVRCMSYNGPVDGRRIVLIHELDLASGELRQAGEIGLAEGDAWPSFVAYSPWLLAETGCPGAGCRVRFFDPRTGALEREVTLPGWARYAAVLADGRLVAAATRGSDDEHRLGLFDPEAGSWIVHSLGRDTWLRIGGEVEPGRLAIFRPRLDDDGNLTGERLELFDLETGELRWLAGRDDNVVAWSWSHRTFWRTATPMAWKPEAWRVFRDGSRGVVRWDPATDTLTTIAGRQE
jgi:hypothetical protein